MPFGISAAIQTGLSAAPLLFGENNIFSGKGRRATKELEKTFKASQSRELPSEYKQYMQSKLAQANMGMPSAALGLYQQQAGRNMASQMYGLSGRRSALAGIGSIAQSGQDAALKLASTQAQAMQQNRLAADQALFQMGGLQNQEQLRKLDESANYWGARKQESNAAITSALKGMASSIANSQMMDAYGAGEKGIGSYFPSKKMKVAQALFKSFGKY